MYLSTVRHAVTPLSRSPVPPQILDQAETLTDAFLALCERFPEFECLVTLDGTGREERTSLATLWHRARTIQGALEAHGLQRGGFVILSLPTGPEIVAAYFAAMLAGGIPGLVATPSNRVADRRVYAAHLGRIAGDAGAHIVYCDAEIAALAVSDPDVFGGRLILTPAQIDRSTPSPIVAATPNDVATVQYSSGSTGAPKGILLEHRAMLNNIRAVRDGLGLRAGDVSVNWIPLYHDMGLIDAFLLPFLTGSPTVLIPTMQFMRDPALWLWAIHRYRGAISWAPNFAYALCAKRVPSEELAGLDLSSWRIAINAAEPVLAHTIDAFTSRFGPYGFRPEAMTPAWGLAENVTIATAHPVGERPLVERVERDLLIGEGVARPISGDGMPSVAIGQCLPHCTVEIRDVDGRPLPERHLGAVWLRSNSLLAGYHHAPALTARVLVDGWLDTGDRGYLAGGHLFFLARDKDLIVVGGAKYPPHDIETVINAVPGVREGCAVAFGVLNEERGTEDVAAVVETRETESEQLNALRTAIRVAVTRATGLALRHVILVPPGGIQKTTSGKLARRATQQRYADQLSA